MDKNQEKEFKEEAKRTLEKVRLQGLKAGATGILGAVLKMCDEGKNVRDIKEFCIRSLNKNGMKD